MSVINPNSARRSLRCDDPDCVLELAPRWTLCVWNLRRRATRRSGWTCIRIEKKARSFVNPQRRSMRFDYCPNHGATGWTRVLTDYAADMFHRGGA